LRQHNAAHAHLRVIWSGVHAELVSLNICGTEAESLPETGIKLCIWNITNASRRGGRLRGLRWYVN